jgi:hypothetical protein
MASKLSQLDGSPERSSGAPSAPTGQGGSMGSPRLGGLQLNDVAIVVADRTIPLPPPGVGFDDDDSSSTENEEGDFKREETPTGYSRHLTPFGPDPDPASGLAANQPPALPSADGGGSGALALRRRQTDIGSASHDEKDDLKQGTAPRGLRIPGLGGGQGQPNAPAPGGIRPADLIRGGPGSIRRASIGSQPDRVRTVQATMRSWRGEGLLAGTMIGLAVGAVVTGVTVATGGLAAAFGGLILAGAMLAGGGAGWSIGSFLGGGGQQKTHLDQALDSLDRAGERLTQAEADRLTEVTDAQWRDLLHVPRSGVADRAGQQELREDLMLLVAKHGYARAAAARDLFHVPRSEVVPNPRRHGATLQIEIDRDARREIRQDLVLCVGKYGYQQTAKARDLLNVPRSLEVPGLERRTTRRVEIDRVGRQRLREHLVFNVGMHGHERTMAEKPALLRMTAAGARWPVPVDLDDLRRSVRVPGRATLYGAYDFDLERRAVDRLGTGPEKGFFTTRGPGDATFELAQLCVLDVPRFSTMGRMALIAADGTCEELKKGLIRGASAVNKDQRNAALIAARLATYVGNRDGDQAAVVKNLSEYLRQTLLVAMYGPVQRLYTLADGPYVLDRDGRDHWLKIDVRESEDRDSYLLEYSARSRITGITKYANHEQQPAHGHLEVSMSIRVQRADLAAGRRDFAFVKRPSYDLDLTMGPAPQGGPQISSRPNDRR